MMKGAVICVLSLRTAEVFKNTAQEPTEYSPPNSFDLTVRMHLNVLYLFFSQLLSKITQNQSTEYGSLTDLDLKSQNVPERQA